MSTSGGYHEYIRVSIEIESVLSTCSPTCIIWNYYIAPIHFTNIVNFNVLAVQVEVAKSPFAIFLCQHKTVQKNLSTFATFPKIIDYFQLKCPPYMKVEKN